MLTDIEGARTKAESKWLELQDKQSMLSAKLHTLKVGWPGQCTKWKRLYVYILYTRHSLGFKNESCILD